jgi:hypothetical protein
MYITNINEGQGPIVVSVDGCSCTCECEDIISGAIVSGIIGTTVLLT